MHLNLNISTVVVTMVVFSVGIFITMAMPAVRYSVDFLVLGTNLFAVLTSLITLDCI